MFFLTYTVLNAFYSSSTALVLAVASLGLFSTEADAATSYCYETELDDTVCVLSVYQTKELNVRLVKSSLNGQVQTDEVYCNPAFSNNYEENLWGVACYEFTFN